MKKKLMRFILNFIVSVQRIVNFFKKKAYLDIDYVHETKDGKTYRVKDSFNIYICRWGKCWSLFRGIDWAEAEKVLKTLETSKGKVILSMRIGMGESNLEIPKWAKRTLIEALRKELSGNE